MSDSPTLPMRRCQTVARDLRCQPALQSKCSALDRAHRESLVVLTLEVHPGHKRVRTAATRARKYNALQRATIGIPTTRTNRAALAIWTERIAVPSTMTNERDVRLVHARWFH